MTPHVHVIAPNPSVDISDSLTPRHPNTSQYIPKILFISPPVLHNPNTQAMTTPLEAHDIPPQDVTWPSLAQYARVDHID